MEALTSEYLMNLNEISNEEKKRLNKRNDKRCEFKINNGSIVTIKQYDCKNNSLFSDILQIETSFHLNNTSMKVINKKIISMNPIETLGVYIYNLADNLIIFRTICHCPLNQYIHVVRSFLEGKEGHLRCVDRFNNFNCEF